jgi:membrane-associated phospholipid phosphatase
MIPPWALFLELGFFLVLALLPGAIAGIVIGWPRGRLKAGLLSGAIAGTIGGIIGAVAFVQYRNSLPSVERRDVFGPYREYTNPPPLYVLWLSMLAGSLILAILCAIIWTSVLPRLANKQAAVKSSRSDTDAEAGQPRD